MKRHAPPPTLELRPKMPCLLVCVPCVAARAARVLCVGLLLLLRQPPLEVE